MKQKLAALTLAALTLCLPARAEETQALDTAMAPSGMVMVGDALYVADTYHRAVWAVEHGTASLLTGRMEVTDLFGQPVAGYNDDALNGAAFSQPWDIVPYDDGFLVSDAGNHVLRYIDLDQERVYTAVGAGTAGYRNDTGEKAAFDMPTGLAVDDEGTV